MEEPKEIADVAQLEAIISSAVAERISEHPWIEEKFHFIKQVFEHDSAVPHEQFTHRQLTTALNMIGDSDFNSPLAIAYYSRGKFNPLHIRYGSDGAEGLGTGNYRRVGRLELIGREQRDRTDLISFEENSFIDFADIIWDCRRHNGRIELELSDKHLRDWYDINIHQFQRGAYIERQLDKGLQGAN